MSFDEKRTYEVLFARYGSVEIEASSEEEARKIALEECQEDDISWEGSWEIDTLVEAKGR